MVCALEIGARYPTGKVNTGRVVYGVVDGPLTKSYSADLSGTAQGVDPAPNCSSTGRASIVTYCCCSRKLRYCTCGIPVLASLMNTVSDGAKMKFISVMTTLTALLATTPANAQPSKVAVGISGWTGFAPLVFAKE